MDNKDSNELTYDELINLINTVKTYSGCDEVTLVGNNKAFENLTSLGLPLDEFKCKVIFDELDETKLFIIPVGPKHQDNIKIKFVGVKLCLKNYMKKLS